MRGNRGKTFVGLRKRVDPETRVDGSETQNRHLANTSMLQLSLAKEVHRPEVGKAEGVESNITNIPLKIGRLLKEGKSLTGDVSRSGFSSNSLLPDGSSCTAYK
jgi:hypothetical protein